MDKDYLKWVTNEKNVVIIVKFHENFCSKTFRREKLGHSSNMQNYALMHHECLKGGSYTPKIK